MANEKCVVRFLVVSLVGFVVLLISNIVGPFDSLPYKIVSIVILGCIVVIGTVHFGKRLVKKCCSCFSCKTSTRQDNVAEGNRSRQHTVPQEELLEIFPELRRLSQTEDDVNVQEETPQDVRRQRQLSVVTEENEDEVENSNLLTPQSQGRCHRNEEFGAVPHYIQQTSRQEDHLQALSFRSEHPQTATPEADHRHTEPPQQDYSQTSSPRLHHPQTPFSPTASSPLLHDQAVYLQLDRPQTSHLQEVDRPQREASETAQVEELESNTNTLVRSRESSVLSRQSSDLSFESAMDCEYPPPYDSTLPYYNDILQPDGRSTL